MTKRRKSEGPSDGKQGGKEGGREGGREGPTEGDIEKAKKEEEEMRKKKEEEREEEEKVAGVLRSVVEGIILKRALFGELVAYMRCPWDPVVAGWRGREGEREGGVPR